MELASIFEQFGFFGGLIIVLLVAVGFMFRYILKLSSAQTERLERIITDQQTMHRESEREQKVAHAEWFGQTIEAMRGHTEATRELTEMVRDCREEFIDRQSEPRPSRTRRKAA